MAMAREKNFFMAKISENAGRYDDARMFMLKVIGSLQAGVELTAEERNLLTNVYKNVVDAPRSSWRNVCSNECNEEETCNHEKVGIARTFRDEIEAEISDICNEILSLIDEHLLPPANSAESKVCYLKMKGDYNRYIAEFKIGAERGEYADKTLEAYKAAQDIALAELVPTNPIRLGLALNFSVLYYEILNSPEQAISLARQAIDDATGSIETSEEELHDDSTQLMQLLRDNLAMWNSDSQDYLPDTQERTQERGGRSHTSPASNT